jgi:hypothetical protein
MGVFSLAKIETDWFTESNKAVWSSWGSRDPKMLLSTDFDEHGGFGPA